MDVALRDQPAREITVPEPVPAAPVQILPQWRLSTRIAFRFCFVYFGVYILVTQMLPAMNPFGGLPVLSTLSVVSAPVTWVIRHVFHDDRPPMIFSAAAATRCSTGPSRSACSCCGRRHARLVRFDRRRPNYGASTRGSGCSCVSPSARRCQLRMAKAIPLQMPSRRSRGSSSRSATSRRWACSGTRSARRGPTRYSPGPRSAAASCSSFRGPRRSARIMASSTLRCSRST